MPSTDVDPIQAKFRNVKLNSLQLIELGERKAPGERSDRQTVRLGNIVHVIGGYDAAGTFHVFDNNRGFPGICLGRCLASIRVIRSYPLPG